MAVWIHCNSCHNFWNTFPSKGSFYLSRCGHLLCSACNTKALRSDSCLVCKSQNVVTVDICSEELPENIRVFFAPGEKVRQQLLLSLEELRKHADGVREATGRVFECAKIGEFQNTNESRLLLFTRDEYLALTQRIKKAEADAKFEKEKRMEVEEAMRRMHLEYDEYKRSHPSVNPFIAGGQKRHEHTISSDSLSSSPMFDLPPRSYVPNTPTFRGPTDSTTTRPSIPHSAFLPSPSPSPTPSNKALDAIRDITSAVQANSAIASRHFTSSLSQDLRHTSVNSPTFQKSSRGPDARMSLKASSLAPSSPAPQNIQSSTGRISVAAFQGKTRNECLQMTPGTVISDSCSVGSFYSPVSAGGTLHRRPGSVVAAPSPVAASLPRSTDTLTRSFPYTPMNSGYPQMNSGNSSLLSNSQSALFKSNQSRR